MKATYVLIAICTVVFLLELLLGWQFTYSISLRPIDLLSEPWLVITSMFAHSDPEHILFNMIALFMFGSVLENRVGSRKFLFIYFTSGVIGALGFMLFSSPFDVALGASGAIYGIIGALVLLEPNLLVYFYGIPIPMYVAGPIYALIELVYFNSADSIAHSAHLLGFFGGLALAIPERGAAPVWPPRPVQTMELWKAIGIPIALSLVVAVIAGAYYSSNPLNQKILGCEYQDTEAAANACFLALSKEYKNSPQQQAYVCSVYDRWFDDNACVKA